MSKPRRNKKAPKVDAPLPAWMTPPFSGWIQTTGDALLILEASRRGLIPRVTRRLQERERALINSGTIFVFDENESGMKRWTDGKFWSPSRILGNFLLYRETDKRALTDADGDADKELGQPSSLLVTEGFSGPDEPTRPEGHALSRPKDAEPPEGIDRAKERSLLGSLTNPHKFKTDGLMKKTFSLTTAGVVQHLVSYYRTSDVESGRLRTPSSLLELACLDISADLLDKTNFRNPPKVEIGIDGIPRYRGEADEAPASLDSGNSSPLSVQPAPAMYASEYVKELSSSPAAYNSQTSPESQFNSYTDNEAPLSDPAMQPITRKTMSTSPTSSSLTLVNNVPSLSPETRSRNSSLASTARSSRRYDPYPRESSSGSSRSQRKQDSVHQGSPIDTSPRNSGPAPLQQVPYQYTAPQYHQGGYYPPPQLQPQPLSPDGNAPYPPPPPPPSQQQQQQQQQQYPYPQAPPYPHNTNYPHYQITPNGHGYTQVNYPPMPPPSHPHAAPQQPYGRPPPPPPPPPPEYYAQPPYSYPPPHNTHPGPGPGPPPPGPPPQHGYPQGPPPPPSPYPHPPPGPHVHPQQPHYHGQPPPPHMSQYPPSGPPQYYQPQQPQQQQQQYMPPPPAPRDGRHTIDPALRNDQSHRGDPPVSPPPPSQGGNGYSHPLPSSPTDSNGSGRTQYEQRRTSMPPPPPPPVLYSHGQDRRPPPPPPPHATHSMQYPQQPPHWAPSPPTSGHERRSSVTAQ